MNIQLSSGRHTMGQCPKVRKSGSHKFTVTRNSLSPMLIITTA